jgi:hypothetical protein
LLQVITANLNRRGTKSVLRENTGNSAAFIQQNDSEVFAPHFANASFCNA